MLWSRRLFAVVLCMTAVPAWAGDIVDRVRIPELLRRDQGRPVYMASLAPLSATLPLFQISYTPPGGGGLTIGTTTITGGATTEVLFNLAGVVSSDAGLTYVAATDLLTVTGGFRAPAGSDAAAGYGFTNEAGAGMWNNTSGGNLYIVKGGNRYVSFGNSLVYVEGTNTLESNRLVLTTATMTATAGATGAHTSSTHAYTWTNAQVVALGASLTGDITVATLPAKTQVLDAAVVITGTAAGVTTLTVSCGDAVGGTPFINYIVASDAKAVVNTFYGDAVAERGTSIDTEFYYLPSYTATTLVTCHFISTVQNLDQTTGSTGRVILMTRLLP